MENTDGERERAGLEVRGVHHAFGSKPVLNGVTLDVAPGEILCLLGPSGCGKTTTLRLIAGLEQIQAGTIAIGGRQVAAPGADVPPERRGVSLLFQDFALFPHLTVFENVTFGLRHLPRAERRARAEQVLEQVGMLSHAASYPHELSGGEQQRVALARARAPKPRVLLMDEPFSNLDVRLRGQVRDIVLHVLKNSPASTLMVTHDPEEAMFMADRIAVMQAGRILQVDRPEVLYAAPADSFVAGLFSELNRLRGTVRDGHVVTQVGRLCTPQLADGTPVDVLIRPEALILGSPGANGGGPAVQGRVVAARPLGRSSLVQLSVGDGSACHLHARLAGRRCPAQDELVGIALDPEQIFVFPAEEPT